MVPPACSLDESGLGQQLARYRGVGNGAEVLERSPNRLVIRVGGVIPAVMVEELVAVERRCCPFFALGWEPEERCLSISVSRPEDEPALDAIAYALGLPAETGVRRKARHG